MAGGVNNAGLILSLFCFYTVIIVVMGLIGTSFVGQDTTVTGGSVSISEPTTNPLTIFGYIGLFFSGLFFSIGALGIALNTLLFGPGIAMLAYIIASFVRGVGA